MEEEETFRYFENDWKCRVLGEGENLRHEETQDWLEKARSVTWKAME